MVLGEKKGVNKEKARSVFQDKLLSLEREFLELRLSKSVGQVKDVSRFKKIRAEIARLRFQSRVMKD